MNEHQLIRVACLLKRLNEQKCASLMKKYDLRAIELEILSFLNHERDQKSATDIVQAKKISKAHISKSLENLRVRECIMLNEEATDRRKVQISLTNKGKKIASEFHCIQDEIKPRIWNQIAAEDMNHFQSILSELCDNLLNELKKEGIKF